MRLPEKEARLSIRRTPPGRFLQLHVGRLTGWHRVRVERDWDSGLPAVPGNRLSHSLRPESVALGLRVTFAAMRVSAGSGDWRRTTTFGPQRGRAYRIQNVPSATFWARLRQSDPKLRPKRKRRCRRAYSAGFIRAHGRRISEWPSPGPED